MKLGTNSRAGMKLALLALAGVASPHANGQCPLSFGTPIATWSGDTPYAVRLADVNLDGLPDAVVVNFADGSGPGSISVIAGTTGGVAGVPIQFAAGDGPHSVAVADLNDDMYPDLVVANFRSGTVSVLFGLGSSEVGFASAIDIPIGPGASDVAVADFNGDGTTDLAVSCWGDGMVRVLLGLGDGQFSPAVHYPVASGSNALEVADVDRDGRPDLLVACYSANVVSVLQGRGDGTFMPASSTPAGQDPGAIATGDLNQDGWPDIVIANVGHSAATVLLGGPGGAFSPAPLCQLGADGHSITLADLNHDGKLDIAASSWGAGRVILALGNGDGTFQLPVQQPVAPQLAGIDSSDLDGDGRPDLAVVSWAGGDLITIRNTSTNITRDPVDTRTCPTGGGTFSVTAGGAGLSYRWQREEMPLSDSWVDLENGPSTLWDGGVGGALLFGAGSPTLFIVANSATGGRLTDQHAIRYRCTVNSSACGVVWSHPAQLIVCAADTNCDGFLDFFDYDDFVIAYESGTDTADFNGDSFLDFFDYDDFVAAFERGC